MGCLSEYTIEASLYYVTLLLIDPFDYIVRNSIHMLVLSDSYLTF